MPIGALSGSTPTGGDVAGTSGPAQLQDIKTQLRASFPAFVTGDDVVTLTAGQINEAAQKNATQTITAAWDFTALPTVSGVPLATQAWVAGERAYGAIRSNGSTFTPAGGAQTVTLPSALGSEKNVTRSTTGILVIDNGTYRVSWGFSGRNNSTTSSGFATIRPAIDGVVTSSAGIGNVPTDAGDSYTLAGEGHVDLNAGQTVSLQMNNFTAGGAVSHDSFLLVERVD